MLDMPSILKNLKVYSHFLSNFEVTNLRVKLRPQTQTPPFSLKELIRAKENVFNKLAKMLEAVYSASKWRSSCLKSIIKGRGEVSLKFHTVCFTDDDGKIEFPIFLSSYCEDFLR